VYLGLESVNPETLKEYNKEASVDDIAGGIAALTKRGISTTDVRLRRRLGHSSFAVPDSRFCHRAWAEHRAVPRAHPLPGTRQTAQLEAEGRVFTRNWSLYDGHHVVHWPKQMTPYELQVAVLQAHKRFYAPRRIAFVKSRGARYRKHQFQGYLIAMPGARAREPRFPQGAQGVFRDTITAGVAGRRLVEVGTEVQFERPETLWVLGSSTDARRGFSLQHTKSYQNRTE